MMGKPRRQFLISALAEDLAWITPVIEAEEFGVEIKDFALPFNHEGARERAFELWHMWWEATAARVPIVLHAPFLDLVPGSPEPEVVALARKQHEEVLTLSETLGSKTVLFHSGFNPLVRGPGYQSQWVSGTARYFAELLELFPEHTILIENMWEPDPEALIALFDALNHPRFKACLDVGHCHVYSPAPPEEWINKLGMRLGHVHLNDNHKAWDQELELGAGTIPLATVFKTLDQLGFFGMVTIEMHGQAAVLESLAYLKRNGFV